MADDCRSETPLAVTLCVSVLINMIMLFTLISVCPAPEPAAPHPDTIGRTLLEETDVDVVEMRAYLSGADAVEGTANTD